MGRVFKQGIMTDLSDQRQAVCQRIQQAIAAAGRPADAVELLAVSKTQPAEQLRTLYAAGQRAFGENYLQEARSKQVSLSDLPIEWHFIGHVQRNKTRELAAHFDWVHGVDRLLIAERLAAQRPPSLPPLQICLQVNIDRQDSKDGCVVEALPELVAGCSRLMGVQLRGLMVIPDPKRAQAAFAETQRLFEDLREYHQQPVQWDTLSMGMSADLEEAIAAGSTIVRIGTALFGVRTPQPTL